MPSDIRPSQGDTSWFVHDRFGLFIHWGLYALPARHEWIMHNEEIRPEVYERYLKYFDPDLYDPAVWAQAASRAGMKYFVVTTKHHEGFCLWDTKLTDYKAPNSPARRDLLRPMIDAFRKENLRVGLYHSLIDWHHPKFMIDPWIGPMRNASDEERAKLNADRNQDLYADYLHAQVRELLTQFGKIDITWFDFSYNREDPNGKGRRAWRSEELYKLVRQLQPHVILNDRLDLPDAWDIKTPEQYQPREWYTVDGQRVVWEACQTFSGSWGYHRDESSWKSIDQLVQMLIDTVSKGGNLLLNVGPTGRGEFDARALDRLNGFAEWMRRHGRSIYGCTQAPEEFKAPQDCRFTYNPQTRRLYLHIFAWPFQFIHLDGIADKIEYAQLLNDASEVKMKTNFSGLHGVLAEKTSASTLTLELPIQKPNVTVPVVELFLK